MQSIERHQLTRRAAVGRGLAGLGALAAAANARPLLAQSVDDPLTEDEISLVFLGHVAGGDREQATYDSILAMWHELHPNIKVEYQLVPDQDRITRVQSRIAGGQAPDLWRHNHNVVRLWASEGLLLDLTDLLPANYHEIFLPALMATCRFQDRTYGLPHTTDTSSLFYRKDALDAIGVEPPASMDAGWTWDEFDEICNQVIALGNQDYAFSHNQGAGRWVPSFLYSSGGRIVDDEMAAMAINTPEAARAFGWVKSWTENEWVSPGIWDSGLTNPNESSDEFIRGTASMAILGQWNITYLDEQIRDQFEWGVTYLPHDQIQTTSLGGTPIVASATTEHPREVAAFMEFFTSAEMIKLFAESANYMPVRTDVADMDLTFQVRDDLMQVFKELIVTMPQTYGEFVSRTFSSGVTTIITEESSRLMFEDITPEESVATVESRGNEFIQANPDPEAV